VLGQWRHASGASGVAVWVIPTNEELMLARHTQAVLARPGEKRS